MTRTLAIMAKHTTVLTNGKLMPACACASDTNTNCRGFSPGALVEQMCPARQELPESRYNAAARQGHASEQVCTCSLRGPGEQVCTCLLRAPGERVLPAGHELLARHRDLLLSRYVQCPAISFHYSLLGNRHHHSPKWNPELFLQGRKSSQKNEYKWKLTEISMHDGLKKHFRYLNFDVCLINFLIKKVNSGSESRASERGNENLRIQNLLCIWSFPQQFPGLANWKNQKHHWDSEESQFQPVFGYVLQVYSPIFLKKLKSHQIIQIPCFLTHCSLFWWKN
jgi:hypothetical protein